MLKGITERELRRAELPPTEYVVGIPLYPVGGTVFLYGPPGIGKSFITQGLNHTIAWGVPAGGFVPQHTANILYCDFEGTPSITKERSLDLTPWGAIAADETGAEMPTDTTYVFGDQWKGRNFAERLAELEDLLVMKENESLGYSLVILDTYTAFVGSKPGMENAYDYDRAVIEALNQVALRCQVCILLIHHPNKAGEMSGSTGRAGTAWVVAGFEKIDERQAVLRTDKNRVGREIILTYERDDHDIWRLSTRLDPKAAMVKGSMRAVLQQLAAAGPQRRAELIEATGIPGNSINQVLARLKTRGQVEIYDGYWRTTFEPGNAPPAVPVHSKFAQAFDTDLANAGDLAALGAIAEDVKLFKAPDAGAAMMNGQEIAQLRETFMRRRDELAPARIEQGAEGTAAQAPGNPQPAGRTWRDMARAKPKAAVPPPVIDATYTIPEDGQWHWNTSPISTAIDLIMGALDRGRLSPTWRTALSQEIADPIDGQHRWGQLPQRYMGNLRNEPDQPWVSYDVRGSFLAAYRTHLAVKALPAPAESDGSDWTRKSAGMLEVFTPEWDYHHIGHPMGSRARPGTWQWVAAPTYRLLVDLATRGEHTGSGMIDTVAVRRSALRTGYQEASEALLEGFIDLMRAGREQYEGEQLIYIKEMYSAWLSSAKNGKTNVFHRPDWWLAIRSEAFARLWRNGLKATELPRGETGTVELLGMGNTDELCIASQPGVDQAMARLFPLEDKRIGKMVLKDRGHGTAR